MPHFAPKRAYEAIKDDPIALAEWVKANADNIRASRWKRPEAVDLLLEGLNQAPAEEAARIAALQEPREPATGAVTDRQDAAIDVSPQGEDLAVRESSETAREPLALTAEERRDLALVSRHRGRSLTPAQAEDYILRRRRIREMADKRQNDNLKSIVLACAAPFALLGGLVAAACALRPRR